jgi:hypothetical protein
MDPIFIKGSRMPASNASSVESHPNPGAKMKTALFAILLLTADMAMAQKDDMEVNHLGSGLAFFYEGKAHHNCKLIAVNSDTVRFSSADGEFDAVWSKLPGDVKKRLLPSYQKIVDSTMARQEAQFMKFGKVEQIVKGGILIEQGESTIFIYGPGEGLADGDMWQGKAYPAGLFKYVSVIGAETTVHAFSTDADQAAKLRGDDQ